MGRSQEDESKDRFFEQLGRLSQEMVTAHDKDFAMGALILAARWAKWTDIDALATDAEPDGELREAILAGGTRIHCA